MVEEHGRGRWGQRPLDGGPRPVRVVVRRSHLLEDSWAALRELGPGLKGRVEVKFISALGIEEAGLDHGGLLKELLEEVRCSLASCLHP